MDDCLLAEYCINVWHVFKQTLIYPNFAISLQIKTNTVFIYEVIFAKISPQSMQSFEALLQNVRHLLKLYHSNISKSVWNPFQYDMEYFIVFIDHAIGQDN